MTGEPGEARREDENQVPHPPVPERYDPVAEVTEPGTQPDVEEEGQSNGGQEVAPAPEAEGEEFDYEAEVNKVQERYKMRIEKFIQIKGELFGSEKPGDNPIATSEVSFNFDTVLREARAKKENNEGDDRRGEKLQDLTQIDRLVIALGNKLDEIRKERGEVLRLLKEKKDYLDERSAMKKIEEI